MARCVNCDREDVYRIIILEDSVGWFLNHHSLRGHSKPSTSDGQEGEVD